MGGYHIAIVGATGAAGTELLRVLERRNFPVASLRPIGSTRSVGKSVQFCGDSIPVEKLDAGSFEKIDVAFFSAGGDVSRNYVPIAWWCQLLSLQAMYAPRGLSLMFAPLPPYQSHACPLRTHHAETLPLFTCLLARRP